MKLKSSIGVFLKRILASIAVLAMLGLLYAVPAIFTSRDEISEIQYQEILTIVALCPKADPLVQEAIPDKRISHAEYRTIKQACS